MAEVVTDFDWTIPPRPSIYPWDEWLDGRTWTAKKGEDYSIMSSSFAGSVYQASQSRRGRAICRIKEDSVTFKFVK